MIRTSLDDWNKNVETMVHWSPFSDEADLLRQVTTCYLRGVINLICFSFLMFPFLGAYCLMSLLSRQVIRLYVDSLLSYSYPFFSST